MPRYSQFTVWGLRMNNQHLGWEYSTTRNSDVVRERVEDGFFDVYLIEEHVGGQTVTHHHDSV